MGAWLRFKAIFSRPTRQTWQRPGWTWQPLELPHIMGLDPGELWEQQPHLRTVTDFIARNVAQLGLQVFDDLGDGERARVRSGLLPQLLRRPNQDQTGYELLYALVADLTLYDRAYWWVRRDADAPTGWQIRPIPASWVVTGQGGTVWAPAEYLVQPLASTASAEPVVVPAREMVHWHGWNPRDPGTGSSPVRALKLILSEQLHAWQYRDQVWQRGGRVSSVIERPMDAPAWGEKGKERFRKDWQSHYTGSGPDAGGTPILEDGMTLKANSFSAREQEFTEAATLSLTTVASVYQVNPTMVGVLENANYSNVREFRRSLYGDSLGPWLEMIQGRLNAFLLPMLGEPERRSVAFDVASKLRGSPEEQASAFQAAVGRPWMTADEARGQQNLPSLGGDAEELVTPMNVMIGGQASPQDSAPPTDPAADSPPREAAALEVVRGKARKDRQQVRPVRIDSYEERYQQRLGSWFDDFTSALLSGYGAAKRRRMRTKAAEDYVDREAWQEQLAALLVELGLAVSTEAGHELLEQVGLPPEEYNAEATVAWLEAMASGVAEGIVGATLFEADAALEDTGREDEDGEPVPPETRLSDALIAAAGSRVPEIANSQVTSLSAFGSTEAVRSAGGGDATKTWRTTSTNPRPEHRRLDGETVGLDERFSNGGQWPGDSRLDDAQRAGCKCAVEMSFEI